MISYAKNSTESQSWLENHQTTQAHLTTRDEQGPRAPVGAQLSAFCGDLTQLKHHVERGTARDVDPRNRCGLTVLGMESCWGGGGGSVPPKGVCEGCPQPLCSRSGVWPQ